MSRDAMRDDSEVDRIVARVQSAFDALIHDEGAYRSTTALASTLRKEAGDRDPTLLVAEALDYGTTIDPESDRRRSGSGPFVPKVSWVDDEGTEICLPPLPTEQPDNVRAFWASLACRSGLPPIVRARLADLVWILRHEAKEKPWFQIAIESYIGSVDDRWGDTLEVRDGLFRGRELSIETNQPELRMLVEKELFGLLQRSLEAEKRAPGMEIPILKLLSLDDSSLFDLDSTLAAAKRKYESDPWSMESLLELETRNAEGAPREEALTDAVRGFELLAAQSEGIQKVAMLQKAAELAALHGLKDVRERIRSEIASLDAADFLKPIRVETSIPRDAVDVAIQEVVGEDSFGAAVARLGSAVPTGSVEVARSFVAELAQTAPLQRLLTSRVLGGFNETVFVAASDGDHDRLQLAQNASQNLLLHSTLIVGPALRQALDKYEPGVGELRSSFETEIVEPIVAENVARAVVLWRNGELNSAAGLLVPYLERSLRRLAALSGRPITRDADPSANGRLGGVLTLGTLLSKLDDVLDESVLFLLRSALTDQLSLNIRNRWAHGLVDEIPEAEVLVLIQLFSLLTRFALSEHGE